MIDDLEALLTEAIQFFKSNQAGRGLLALHTLQGMLLAHQAQENKWALIKQDYEAGLKPRVLARKYSVKATIISSTAYAQQWVNSAKIEREQKKKLVAKNVFTHDCHTCEQKFVATSGHAKYCGQCTATKEQAELAKKMDKLAVKTCLQCGATHKPVCDTIAICDKCMALNG